LIDEVGRPLTMQFRAAVSHAKRRQMRNLQKEDDAAELAWKEDAWDANKYQSDGLFQLIAGKWGDPDSISKQVPMHALFYFRHSVHIW
jgi:hypothetical protein